MKPAHTEPVALKKIYTGKRTLSRLKAAVWLYFLLLIFEGALRKWILPSLAGPLLVVRDPVAILILFESIKKGLLKWNVFLLIAIIVSIVSFFATFFVGHGNLLVAFYGVRIILIHFPLMFAIGKIFNAQDVLKMGRVLLLLSIPMTLLILLQFYSPQSAWVNRGIGGDMEGSGFTGALGFFRPSGTFSFTIGNVLFFGLDAGYIIYFWFNQNFIKKWLLIAGTVCLVIAVPLSISRTLVFEISISVLFGLLAAFRRPNLARKMLIGIVLFILIILSLNTLSFFQTATKAFTTRFETANASEGGLVGGVFIDRFLGGMIGAIQSSADFPFLGYGIGMGTNAGSMLLTGKRSFLIAEGEWGRLIGEMGFLLGIIFIGMRIAFAFHLLIKSYRALQKINFLPWMLLSFAFLPVMQGQWAQPTALGFSVLAGGLILSSLRKPGRYLVHFKC